MSTRIIKNGLLCVVSTIVVLGLLEISLRTYQSLKWNTSLSDEFGGPDQLDAWLGWRPKGFHSYDMNMVDNSGVPYSINYHTYEYGFREWQDESEEDITILFIGDSYTRAKQASNDKVYFSIVKQIHPMNVFAFGGSGYGTLQEYMMFDKFVETIDPEIIVWQFTPNDFFDNDPELNRKYGGVIMGMRPYLIGGSIEYKNVLSPVNQVLFQAAEFTSSRFLHLIHTRYLILTRPDGLYQEINEYGFDHEEFAQSYQTTLEIMKMVVRSADGRKIMAFCVRDRPAFFYNAFLAIMNEVGISVITEVPQALDAAESSGIEIRAEDGGHWNENGHRVVGETIAEALERLLRGET